MLLWDEKHSEARKKAQYIRLDHSIHLVVLSILKRKSLPRKVFFSFGAPLKYYFDLSPGSFHEEPLGSFKGNMPNKKFPKTRETYCENFPCSIYRFVELKS